MMFRLCRLLAYMGWLANRPTEHGPAMVDAKMYVLL